MHLVSQNVWHRVSLAVVGASLVTAMLGTLARPAQAQDLVGYVASVDGAEAQLVRAGVPARRLRLGENVLAGDTVIVVPPTRVRIDTLSGPVDPCVPPPPAGECRHRFPIVETGLKPAEIAGRLSAMAAWFSGPSRNFATRAADPPRLRIGGGGPQFLIAGERGLWVGWLDGEAPFEVLLEGPAGVVARMESQERAARLPPARLPIAPLTLTVIDRSGRRASLSLNVRTTLSRLPDLARQAVSADHRRLLEAAELASHEGGAWSLEAVQRLDALAVRLPLAETVRRALIAGDRI